MAKTRSRKVKGKEKSSSQESRNETQERAGSSRDGLVISMSGDDTSTQKRHRQNAPNGTGSNSNGMPSLQERIRQKEERQGLVLWKHPITTLQYFILESGHLLSHYLVRLWHNKRLVLSLLTLVLLYYGVKLSPGPHQQWLSRVSVQLVWCGWWIWLGVLSSVGLGTGLHTFLLYLGPHIASVTMAAYTCNSLDFPEPPYPDEIICPDDTSNPSILSIWTIMSKVRLEAFMWGAGTALGELPPYFMARGARLSGHDAEDEEMAEFEELQRLKERPEDMSWLDRAKLSVEKLVERVGFFGILACASIPNPLFDLAGITCGHFLVPFWTFFGATLIGKAVIKMHIQKLFVIIAFNENLLQTLLSGLSALPIVGSVLQKFFQEFLKSQQTKLKRKPGVVGNEVKDGPNFVSWAFEKLILVMVAYFILSIINSMAQSYHKRIHKNTPVTPTATTHKPKHAKD